MTTAELEWELEDAAEAMASAPRGQAGRFPVRRLPAHLRRQGFLVTRHFLDRLLERAQAQGIRFNPRSFGDEFRRAQHFRQTRPGYNTRIALMQGLPVLYRMSGWRGLHPVLVGLLPQGTLPPAQPVRPPHLREADFERELVGAASEMEFDSVAPRALTYTTKDVIDNRISVPAQHSLVRLSKDPVTATDAVGMLEEVKAGRLAGIFCVNRKIPAQRASRLGQSWWTVIPKSEDAVLMLDPGNPLGSQPLIAFRRELDPRPEGCGPLPNERSFLTSPSRLDAALLKAWAAYQLLRAGRLVRCDAMPGAVPISNLVPPIFCRVGDAVPLPSAPPRLSPGQIASVQRCLNDILGTRLSSNGILGPETRSAIRSVQQRAALPANGILTRQTMAMLGASCPFLLGGLPPLQVVGCPVSATGQRECVQLRSGSLVGNILFPVSGDNVKEEVLNTMDRLHVLLSYGTENEYRDESNRLRTRPKGSVIAPGDIPSTIKAIMRNQDPILDVLVATNENILNLPLRDNVGRGASNLKRDILILQDRLRAIRCMSIGDHAKEHSEVLTIQVGGKVPDDKIPRTLAGVSALKDRIAGGRLGWAPIHADEDQFGGDRFGGRTYPVPISSLTGVKPKGPVTREQIEIPVFLPARVTESTNKVHVFFSFDTVTGNSGLNGVLGHGLRGSTNASDWILIGVPGKKTNGREEGYFTIDMKAISDCLASAGRGHEIHSLRLSAHSRGGRGLRETLDRSLIDPSLIDRVVILDANTKDIADVLRKSAIPGSKVIPYRVITGNLPLVGARTIRLDNECMRAIGYSRLIKDATVTRPLLEIPKTILDKVLPLPARGCFSSKARTPSPPKVCLTDPGTAPIGIEDFCNTMVRRRKIGPALTLSKFIDDHDLLRIGHKLRVDIAGHHLFVAEIAHEITD